MLHVATKIFPSCRIGDPNTIPGADTAGSLARSSIHTPLPSFNPIACTTPFKSAAYATPPPTAAPPKNAPFPVYVHLSSPLAASTALTFPSAHVKIASPSITAIGETTPPDSGFFHFTCPSSRLTATTSPCPGTSFGSNPILLHPISANFPATLAPPHGL